MNAFNPKILKIRILLFIMMVFGCSPDLISQNTDYAINITGVTEHTFDTKPELYQRLNGSSDVVIVKPLITSILDEVLWEEISGYFDELGIPTSIYETIYEKENRNSGNVTAIIAKCPLSEINFVKRPNTLVLIPTYTWVFSGYNNGLDVNLTFIDLVGRNQWNVKIPDIRVDSGKKRLDKKFNKKIKQLISNSYIYDSNYSITPGRLQSDWNENKLRKYVDEKGTSLIEGVYDIDNERIGVKFDGEDVCLLLHLGGNNFEGWEPGTVKALLEPTATSNIYKGMFWDKYFNLFEATVIFEPGLITITKENSEPKSYLKLYPKLNTTPTTDNLSWSGTGFALKNGYIVTNNHVSDDASNIEIFGVNGDFTKGYKAKVIGKDKVSDIAILKIEDPTIISSWTTPPYSVNFSMADVGEDVFALGYPLIGTMGEEVKLTNGIISSRSGFDGDVTNYQISVPIQPGNSGGPMFNEDGELVGIICAKHEGAENAGYAIKTSYLKNLIESVASSNIVPTNNTLKGKALKDQVKSIRNNVFLIKCSK